MLTAQTYSVARVATSKLKPARSMLRKNERLKIENDIEKNEGNGLNARQMANVC